MHNAKKSMVFFVSAAALSVGLVCFILAVLQHPTWTGDFGWPLVIIWSLAIAACVFFGLRNRQGRK